MCKFVKKIFGIKPKEVEIISYGELPDVKKVMKPSQIIKGMNYYKDNVNRIENMMKETNVACDVSFEDKNNPSLWKPGHWLLFFDKHNNK